MTDGHREKGGLNKAFEFLFLKVADDRRTLSRVGVCPAINFGHVFMTKRSSCATHSVKTEKAGCNLGACYRTWLSQ